MNARHLASLAAALVAITGACEDTSPPARRAPIYFNVFHHQEAAGSVADDFARYPTFEREVLDELALYGRLGIVSDQYFSDFVAEVAQRKGGPDAPLFSALRESGQTLGYHFHPTTWDLAIRLEAIEDLALLDAATAYRHWEAARYDWSPCIGVSPPMFCGTLDPGRPGGIGFMEQAFGLTARVENLSLWHAPVALALSDTHPDLAVGVTGNVHTYYLAGQLGELWKNDHFLSPDRYTYVYRLMGHTFVRGHSGAHIEHSDPTIVLEQQLALLPRDIPHVVLVHVSGPSPQLEANLAHIQAFIADNPGSRFVSAAEIPSLVEPNPRTFSMADLEAACLYLLRNWTGRPPGHIASGDRFMSLASLFQALVRTHQHHIAQGAWPADVSVDDFIMPPVGLPEALPPGDYLAIATPIAREVIERTIASLSPDTLPYLVEIHTGDDAASLPILANTGEILNAMATLFLAERQGRSPDTIAISKGDLVPISNLPAECSCDRCAPATDGQTCERVDATERTRLEWHDALQLWTLEPLRLRSR